MDPRYLLLNDEKVLYSLKPSSKVRMQWFLPSLLVLVLGPIGMIAAMFFFKHSTVRSVYGFLFIAWIVVPFLALLGVLAIPELVIVTLIGISVLGTALSLALCYILLGYVRNKSNLIITDRRVIVTWGLISDLAKTVTYDKISDVKITHGAYENLFGLSSILIETLAGQRLRRRGSLGEFVFEGMSPEDVRNAEAEIMKRMKKAPIQ